MHRIDQMRGVADHHPAVAEQLRHGIVATFRNQVRGVFLHLRPDQQRRHARVRLERIQQPVRRLPGAGEIIHQAADADRDRFAVGIEKRGAGHALGDRAHRLDHHALIAAQAEPAFDQFLRQEVHLLYRQRNVFRLQLARAARPLADQAVHAFRQDHHIGQQRAAMPVGLHADHPVIACRASSSVTVVSHSSVAPASRTRRLNQRSNCARMMV